MVLAAVAAGDRRVRRRLLGDTARSETHRALRGVLDPFLGQPS